VGKSFFDEAYLKGAIRRRIRALRDALPPGDRAERSQKAALACAEALGHLGRLGLFAPIGSEADPGGVPAQGRAFPRIEGKEIRLRWCEPDELRPSGRWSIPEPPPEAPIADGLDLVLVPGLAFDARGERIGYGAGFYDRFIRRLRTSGATTRFVGFGFEFQFVAEALPAHEGDERLDGFVSEAGLRWFAA